MFSVFGESDKDLYVLGLEDADLSIQFVSENNGTLFRAHHVEVMRYIFVYITVSLIPFIILNNILVIASVSFSPSIYSAPHNLLFLSLAVADITMGLYCIPMYALAYLKSTKWYIQNYKFLCLNWFASVEVAAGGSLFNLLAIACDRYLAIMCPFTYARLVTKKRMTIFIGVLWVYILFQAYVPMLGWNNYSKGQCNFYRSLPFAYVMIAALFTVGFCIGVPFVLYIQIIIVIWRQINDFKKYEHLYDEKTRNQFQQKVSSIKLTSTLMFLFIFLWFPYLLMIPLKYSSLSQEMVETAKIFAQVPYFCNAAVNAPVYALSKADYKDSMKIILTTAPWRWKSTIYAANREKFYLQQSEAVSQSRNNEFAKSPNQSSPVPEITIQDTEKEKGRLSPISEKDTTIGAQSTVISEKDTQQE